MSARQKPPGTPRYNRLLGAPRSHQSDGGWSRISAAATSTWSELQNFHSSFAAREYWKNLINVERVKIAGTVPVDGLPNAGDKAS